MHSFQMGIVTHVLCGKNCVLRIRTTSGRFILNNLLEFEIAIAFKIGKQNN